MAGADQEWTEFQHFVSSVEENQVVAEEKEQKEQDAREELEQMQYVDRFRQMLDRVEDENEKKAEKNENKTIDFQLLMKKNKRKRQEEESTESTDLLNWRNKSL